jgi:CBS domain-containing protein
VDGGYPWAVTRSPSDDSPPPITHASPVREVARLLSATEPITVQRGDPLREVAAQAVQHPEIGVLCVVNPAGELVGLIPVSQLVEDIFVKIVPEEFLSHIDDASAALDYAERLGARTAGDIMAKPVSVRPDETVRDAFRKLHESELAGLPVVDDEQHVIGYLDQLELLLAWVEVSGRKQLLEPPPDDATGGRTDASGTRP